MQRRLPTTPIPYRVVLLVCFCPCRGVQILMEVDMPGHSFAFGIGCKIATHHSALSARSLVALPRLAHLQSIALSPCCTDPELIVNCSAMYPLETE